MQVGVFARDEKEHEHGIFLFYKKMIRRVCFVEILRDICESVGDLVERDGTKDEIV